jgi:iron complex transport system permease protein
VPSTSSAGSAPGGVSPARAVAGRVWPERSRLRPERSRPRFRPIVGWVVAVVVLAIVLAGSLAIGSRDIPLDVVWSALLGNSSSSDAVVVLDLRVPRTVAGLAAGIALGVSGAIIQALTRNPLADPGILGVTSGSAFAVAIAVVAFGITAVEGYLWFAFLGALLATVIVFIIGSTGRGGGSPAKLTLAGVALGAVLSGITSGMLLADPEAFNALQSWNAGSLEYRDWPVIAPVLPFLLGGLVLAALITRALNAIALGDDVSAGLGVNLVVVRAIAVVVITVLAGGATAIAGPIAFVGLMVPHVARYIVGPDQRWIFAYTLVLAPILLLAADIVGRIVLRPGELPVGIVTACLGAPVLIALVRRTRMSGL